MEYQNEQFSYDNWSQNSPANKQEMFCGGDIISTNEKYFINTYAKSNCLDVGCGTGNRTFLYYENRQIDYIGVEKYDHLIEYSNNSTKILKKDITSNSFHLDEIKNQKSDVAFYFGGVINGFVSESARLHGWENIEEVAKKHANYILVDTLSHFPWFCDEFEKLGKVTQLNPVFPPQFFYSQKGLKSLFVKHQLDIVEEKEEVIIGPVRRTHYLLQHIEN